MEKEQEAADHNHTKEEETSLPEELTYADLRALAPDDYQIIDIRDQYAFEYGHIPGAMNVPLNELYARAEGFAYDMKTISESEVAHMRAEGFVSDLESVTETDDLHTRTEGFSRRKLLVLCCKSGSVSREPAAVLRASGFRAVSLAGGYYAWMRSQLTQGNKAKQAEQSIRKTFHKELWSRFAQAVKKYDLVQPGDRIAVCISGGKDSMLMAKLFQELQWHRKFPFKVEFLVMDPGYSPENREVIEKNADALSVPIHVFESNIFESVYHVEKNPCYLCARMRRGYLYREAQALGCNKIALGHHYDDVIETILIGMLYGGQVQTMMPKLHSTNFPGMELIRPMYLIREADILRWRDYNGLHFIQCACRFTDTCTTCSPGNTGSKRVEIKNLIRQMKEVNPQVEYNIFRSVEHVNLQTVIGYKDKDGLHSFLDSYNE